MGARRPPPTSPPTHCAYWPTSLPSRSRSRSRSRLAFSFSSCLLVLVLPSPCPRHSALCSLWEQSAAEQKLDYSTSSSTCGDRIEVGQRGCCVVEDSPTRTLAHSPTRTLALRVMRTVPCP